MTSDLDKVVGESHYGNPVWEATAADFANDMQHPQWMITVPCGRCRFCRKRIANAWRFRLYYEIAKYGKDNSWFVTFTISPQYYERVTKNPALAIKQFRDRYRKATGETLRYFIVPEVALGNGLHEESGERSVESGRGRLHFHGILFGTKISRKDLRNLWKYGNITRSRVRSSARCSAYVTKYILKGRDFGMFRIYCSPGIGAGFLTDEMKNRMLSDPGFYKVVHPSGHSWIIPKYFMDKVWKPVGDDTRLIYQLEHPPLTPWRIGAIVYDDYFEYKAHADALFQDELRTRKATLKLLENTHKKYPYNAF